MLFLNVQFCQLTVQTRRILKLKRQSLVSLFKLDNWR